MALIIWLVFFHKVEQVQVAEVTMSAVNTMVSTNGKVEADKIFELRAPFAGVCRRVNAKEGDRLGSGQPIVELDDSAMQSDLAVARTELLAADADLANILRGSSQEERDQADSDVARARLDLDGARKILETNESLLKKGAISRFEVEQSRRDVDRLSLALEAALTKQKNLKTRYTDEDRKRARSRVEAAHARILYLEELISKAVIRAPADGTLYQFDVKIGSFFNAGDLIAFFADLTHLRARVFVDEPDIGKVVLGSEVIVHWDARPSTSWKGIVRRIPTQMVARGSRSVAEVLCSIEGPTDGLIPNVNVDVEILTAQGAEVPSIPRACVFPDGKGHFVWTISDGRVVKRAIDTGRSTPTLIEVTRGLSLGERVIIPGETPMTEGMKVRVIGG